MEYYDSGWQQERTPPWQSSKNNNKQDYYGPKPMDLDSTEERRKPQVKPKGQGKECYNCGKEGHFAKDYKKSRKETRKEIRAMSEFPEINYDNCQVEDS
jgi:hypothetical protein